MSDLVVRATAHRTFEKVAHSAAGRLIAESFAAQAGLVADGTIPAVAETPLPVLDSRFRTPDPHQPRLDDHADEARAYRFAAE